MGKAKISFSTNGISVRYEGHPFDIFLPWIKVDYIGIRKETSGDNNISFIHHLYIASEDGDYSLYLDESMEGWRELMVQLLVYFNLNLRDFEEKVKSLRPDDSAYVALYRRP